MSSCPGMVMAPTSPFHQHEPSRTSRLSNVTPSVRAVSFLSKPPSGVIREGGVLVSIVGPPNPAACAAAKIRCARPDRENGASNADMLARVGELADAGKFKVHVEEAYPLADAAKAWEKSRGGHTRGKLVIRVSSGPTMKHQ